MELVLDLIPQSRLAKGFLHQFVLVTPVSIDAGPPYDIVVDTFRKGIWFLKNHPDFAANDNRINLLFIDVGPMKQHLPLNPGRGDQIIHSVQRTEHSAFAAAGGTDQCGDLVGFDGEVHTLDRVKRAIVNVQIPCPNGSMLNDRGVVGGCGFGCGIWTHGQFLFRKRFLMTIAKAFMLKRRMSRTTMAAAAIWRNSGWGREVHW